MIGVKIPLASFEKLLEPLIRNRESVGICEAVWNQMPDFGLEEVLYHKFVGVARSPDKSRVRENFYPVFVRIFRTLREFTQSNYRQQIMGLDEGLCLIIVTNRENIQGYYYFPGSARLDFDDHVCLSLPGPGMEKILLMPAVKEYPDSRYSGNPQGRNDDENSGIVNSGEYNWRGKYERLAGGIGKGNLEEGFRLLARARNLRVIVIGAGRLGSWLTFRLAQIGVGSTGGLIIADPDIVEESNLDGMLVPPQAKGYPKAFAVASTIAAMFPGTRPVPIDRSLSDREVVDVFRTCDVVFTAVDEDAPRFGSAVLCSRYHIVHIDVCGGVTETGGGRIVAGGEMRVHIPGSPGCISCMGGYDMREIESLLTLSTGEERERRARINWREQRTGSNVDVLLPLIGEALQTLWGILRSEIKESRWLHYEKDTGNLPEWQEWSDRRKFGKCLVCTEMAGLGDMTWR